MHCTLPRICKVEMQQASLLYYSAKPQSGGILGCALVCPTSLYVRTIRFPTFCRSLPCVGAYIVREMRSVRETERQRERERERERDRERDGSDVTLVALKLAMSFALFLAKNLHLSKRRRALHSSLPKIYTLVSPLLRWPTAFVTPLYRNRFIFSTLPDNEMK